MGEDASDVTLESLGELGGDAACWAHLLCPECAIVLNDRGEHREGCSLARASGAAQRSS
jgi:hypothetical protein